MEGRFAYQWGSKNIIGGDRENYPGGKLPQGKTIPEEKSLKGRLPRRKTPPINFSLFELCYV